MSHKYNTNKTKSNYKTHFLIYKPNNRELLFPFIK